MAVNLVRAPFFVPKPVEADVWLRLPTANAPVRLTTRQVQFYGKPGQAPTKQWRYDWDEAAPYQLAPHAKPRTFLGAASAFFPHLWPFGQDDASPWQYIYQRTTLKPNTFGFNLKGVSNFLDDPSVWSGCPVSNNIIQQLDHKPFISATWEFNLDDPSPAWPIKGVNTSLTAVTSNPFLPKQWSFTDEGTTWVGVPIGSKIIPQLDFKPFITVPWNIYNDDLPAWQPSPSRNLDLYVTPFSPRFIPTLDEPAGWTGGIRPVALTISATSPSPFIPQFYRFAQDDSTFWVGKSNNAFFIQTQPISFVSAMWNLNIPQDAPTTFSSISSNSVLNLLPRPVQPTLIQRTLTGVGL